jgi:hypothetical protein
MRPLAVLLSLGLLTFCSGAYKPSTVEGRSVRNPSVGYYGFTVDFPADYSHITGETKPGDPDNSMALLLARAARDFPHFVDLKAEEIIVFAKPNGTAIALIVTRLFHQLSFNRISESRKDSIMRDLLKTVPQGSGKILFRRVERAARHEVMKLVETYHDDGDAYVEADYLVFGKLREAFILVGLTRLADKDELIRDMDATIATLDNDKPKKK